MVSYRVVDIDRALSFYVGLLGMTERARFPGLGPDERELVLSYPEADGAVLMLMWNEKRSTPYTVGDGYNRLTIMVDDVRAALEHLTAQEVPEVVPATKANGVLYAVVKDPDGYMVELLQLGQS